MSECKNPGEFTWVSINNKEELEAFYVSILPKIREAAKKCGYAIGVHGSMRRDLDLIAVPWADAFSDKESLVREIHRAACGIECSTYSWENKPNGRLATCFPVCWTWHEEPMILSNGHIDLSVIHVREALDTEAPQGELDKDAISTAFDEAASVGICPPPQADVNHATHFDDCGCKSAKYEAEIERLKIARDVCKNIANERADELTEAEGLIEKLEAHIKPLNYCVCAMPDGSQCARCTLLSEIKAWREK